MKILRYIGTLMSAALLLCIASSCGSGTSGSFTGAEDTLGMTTEMPAEPTVYEPVRTYDLIQSIDFPDSDFELFGWDYDENGAYYCSDVVLADGNSFVKRDLSGGSISVDNSLNVILLRAPGLYRFTGVLSDGSIMSIADGNVRVILDGATISCSRDVPLMFMGTGCKVITMAGGSVNHIKNAMASDAAIAFAPDYATTAVYSLGDVTINGSGTLHIKSFSGNGVDSSGTVKIMSGTLSVMSLGEGIIGENVVVRGGDINIDTNGGSGIEALGAEAGLSGFFVAENGSLRVTSAYDSIFARRFAGVTGADTKLNLCSGNGSDSQWYDEIYSRKGIHSKGSIAVTGGSLGVDSLDTSLSSEEETLVAGAAALSLCAKRVAISSPLVAIEGGRTEIKKAENGITARQLTIKGGALKIIAADTGIKIQPLGTSLKCDSAFIIGGGNADVNAYASAVIADGKALISDGELFASGGEDGVSPVVSFSDGIKINGGKVMLTAPTGLVQTPVRQSSQAAVTVSFSSPVNGGYIALKSDDGRVLFSRELSAEAGSILFSSPAIKEDGRYYLEVNGETRKYFDMTGTFQNVAAA